MSGEHRKVFSTGKHCSYGVCSSVYKARFCGVGFVDRLEHPVLSVFFFVCEPGPGLSLVCMFGT